MTSKFWIVKCVISKLERSLENIWCKV